MSRSGADARRHLRPLFERPPERGVDRGPGRGLPPVCARAGRRIVDTYTDAALSGASRFRPGFRSSPPTPDSAALTSSSARATIEPSGATEPSIGCRLFLPPRLVESHPGQLFDLTIQGCSSEFAVAALRRQLRRMTHDGRLNIERYGAIATQRAEPMTPPVSWGNSEIRNAIQPSPFTKLVFPAVHASAGVLRSKQMAIGVSGHKCWKP
jgi:hypothetical protein